MCLIDRIKLCRRAKYICVVNQQSKEAQQISLQIFHICVAQNQIELELYLKETLGLRIRENFSSREKI